MKVAPVLIFGAAAAFNGGYLTGCAATGRVSTEQVACDLTKARWTTVHRASAARVAFCDNVVRDANPPGYYVLALHSDRQCDGICSTNLGWYAVRKSDGEVFEWDVGEWRLGATLRREDRGRGFTKTAL